MERSRPDYLMNQLLNNKLSKEEFEELLAGIGEKEMSKEYSDILERYFNQLLIENSINKTVTQKVDL